MRILLAPTAFKGSFSPAQVAQAFHSALESYAEQNLANISIDVLPIADGGDGTVDSLALALGGKKHKLPVHGALAELRTAEWLEFHDTAVIELASACGIASFKKDQLDPLNAHTGGLGTVIRHVLQETKLEKIIIALGGSASTDGGAAALAECGVEFFEQSGAKVFPRGGASLAGLSRVDFSNLKQLIAGRQFFVATDVENPLLGTLGAASVFGPQKGANQEQVQQLDFALAHFAELIEAKKGKKYRDLKGAGAAGGTAFGLVAAFDAKIISGFEWFSSLVRLDERVAASDLIISGEGRIDRSSFHGKVIGSLQKFCSQYEKRLWLVAGSIEDGLNSQLDSSVEKILAAGSAVNYAGLDEITQTLLAALKTSA